MPPFIIVVIFIATNVAYDAEIESEGEWNTIKEAIRSKGFLTPSKWRENNNPPSPRPSGPFTIDQPLVIPAESVYVNTDGLEF